jgi:hypothetical protein
MTTSGEQYREDEVNVIVVPPDKMEAAMAALRAVMAGEPVGDQGAGTGCKSTSPSAGETDYFCRDHRW